MLTMKELREGIRLSLAQFVVYVRYSVSQDMTDINRYAEDFYCGLLNKAFGWKLHNLNQDNRNQPAIDLADDTNKIAVQVTSSTDRGKVTGTLKRFFDRCYPIFRHLENKDYYIITAAGSSNGNLLIGIRDFIGFSKNPTEKAVLSGFGDVKSQPDLLKEVYDAGFHC